MLRRRFLSALTIGGTGLALLSNLGGAKASSPRPSFFPAEESAPRAIGCRLVGLNEQDFNEIDNLLIKSGHIQGDIIWGYPSKMTSSAHRE
jgi:hypothetical protein